MASVAALLAIDRTTLTAALKPLERRGLIKVAPDRLDRRSRRLSLTAQGKALLASAVPVWEKVHGEMEAQLGSEDANRLRRGLMTLS